MGKVAHSRIFPDETVTQAQLVEEVDDGRIGQEQVMVETFQLTSTDLKGRGEPPEKGRALV